MKTTEDLFQLIQSLSPAEKGYFKKYVQHDEARSKSYVKLFDAINGQQEYDEEKLKKKFAKEISNFSAAKNYLFDTILDSLKITHRHQDVFAQTIDLMLSADILAGRRLFVQAERYLEEVHQIAEKNSAPNIHLLAFDRELMIASIENHREKLLRLTNQGMDSATGWIEDISTDMGVRRLVTWVTLYRMIYSGPSTDRERQELLHKAKEFVAQMEQMKLHANHRISLEQLKYIVCEETGDIATGYKHVVAVIERIKELKISQPGMETNMVASIWNAGSYCLRNYPNRALQYAEQLEEYVKLKNQSPFRVAAGMAERFRYNLLIHYYNQAGDAVAGAKIVAEIKDWLEKNERSVPPRITSKLHFETAVYYFGIQDYRLCLLYLQYVRTNPDTDRNTLLSAMVLELIIQYESDGMEYLKPLIKPLKDELYQYKMGDSFYQLAYDCFNLIVRNSEPRNVSALLAQLLEKIESKGIQAYSRNPALMKILLPWLQSRRDKTSFLEAVRKIYAERSV